MLLQSRVLQQVSIFIFLSNSDGRKYDFYYNYTTLTDSSANSPKRSLYCAPLPAPPITLEVIQQDISKIILKWSISPTGALPILGYKLYGKKNTEPSFGLSYDGSTINNITEVTVTMVNGLAISVADYTFEVSSINLVGESATRTSVAVSAVNLPSSTNTTASGTGIANYKANSDESIVIQVFK